MRKQRKKALLTALFAVAVAALGFAGPAQAKLVEPYLKFQYCPWKNPEVRRCILATTEGGEVTLGKKTVPITNKVLLQGGYGAADKTTKIAKFYGATEGKKTLAEVPQSVPGGLLGIVPDKESPFLVKRLIKFFFENSLTGLNSTLQLAGSPSSIEISESNMIRKEKLALKLPVKIRLENPFLGSKCYVGSDSNPIFWNLTSGKTAPPEPNKTIEGSAGKITFLEEGLMLRIDGNKLVDNAWSAPKATGCGGILAFLVNPIVNTQLGTTTAGNNTAILQNTIEITSPFALDENDKKNP